MIKGSCMCGETTYAINRKIGDITHCHCTTFRKAHGSAFSSVAAVQIDHFEFTQVKISLSVSNHHLIKLGDSVQIVVHTYTPTEKVKSIKSFA